MERLDEACGIGVGSAGRVSGAMDTVRYEPCPSRNGSGCSTAGHKTKALTWRRTPWRGLGWYWKRLREKMWSLCLSGRSWQGVGKELGLDFYIGAHCRLLQGAKVVSGDCQAFGTL